MKTHKSLPATRRAAPAKAPPRVRPANSAWERQARSAAQKALRGAPLGSADLTSAPAAARHSVSGSQAEKLPAAERAWLERVFRADLSQVRVRRDAAAGQAARDAAADAFTAGPEIFFAPGKFATGSTEGRELLAHEVAHVLQQTGVRDQNGRWRATARFGFADPQAQGGTPPDPPPNVWATIKRIHLDAAGGDAGFATFANQIGVIIGNEVLLGRPNLGGKALEEKVTSGGYDSPKLRTRARALLYDVLKFQGLFDGAEHLVEISPDLQTIAAHVPFFDEMKTRHGFDWLTGVFLGEHTHPGMIKWFERLAGAWRIGVLRSRGNPPALPGLKTSLDETKQELLEDKKLGRNEREYEALTWLNGEDEERVKGLLTARETNIKQWRIDHPGLADPSPFTLQVLAAKGLSSEAKSMAETYTGPAQDLKRAYFRAAHTQLLAAAMELETASAGVDELEARLQREDLKTLLEEPMTGDALVAKQKSARKLRMTLVQQARAILALNTPPKNEEGNIDNMLPSAKELGDRIAAAVKALDADATRLQQATVDVAGADKPNQPLLDRLLFLRAWVDEAQKFLSAGVEAPAGTDERLEFRIRFARIFGIFAVEMGWQDLADKVRPALNAEDFQFSYVILLADWEKEPDVPLANMPGDLPGIVNFEVPGTDPSGKPTKQDVPIPVNGSVLYYLFQFIQIQRLQEAAELEIQRVKGASGEQRIPDFQGIVKAGRDFTRPQRWRIPPDKYRFVRLPGENLQPGDLVWSHPYTRNKAAQDPEWSSAWLNLNPRGDARRMIMWVIPPITDASNPTRLVDAVKRNETGSRPEARALNDLVVEKLGREAASDLEWLITLGQAADSPEMVATFTRRIIDLLEAERTVQQQPLAPRFRLLDGLARLALVDLIRPRLAAFKSDGITNYSVPMEIIDLVRNYGSWIQPVEEQQAQIAALYLALAQDLDSAFEYEDRGDILTSYYEVARMALDNSAGDALPAFERILLPGADLPKELTNNVPRESYGWFSRRRVFLERMRDRFEEKMRQQQEKYGFEAYGGALHSLTFATPLKTGEANGFVVAIRPTPLGRPGPTPTPYAPTSPIYYEIVEIHRPFRFHRAQGYEGTPSYRPPILKELNETDQTVAGLSVGTSMEPGGAIPPSSEVLLTVLYALDSGDGHEETVQIRADDYEWLSLLAAVVDEQSFTQGMANTAELMQAGAELALDLVELVPGPGQGVAVARVLVTVTDFVVNELPVWRDKLMDDPAKLVEEIAGKLDPSNLTFERVWNFLILPSGTNPFGDYLKGSPKRKQRLSSRGSGRLGRLVAAVQSIRARFAASFGRIRDGMQGPLLAAQATVNSRPVVHSLLSNLPNYLVRAEEAVAELPSAKLGALFENPQAASAAISGDMRESVENLLEGLSDIELPQEVIPLELAVEILLAKVLDKFGAKGRLVRRVLEATGALGQASQPIADALRESPVDPNNLWREFVLPPLQQRFETLRDELVSEIYTLLNGVLPVLGVPPIEQPSALPPVSVQATEPFPEADLWADEDMDTARGPLPVQRPRFTGGERLSAASRQRFEGRYGHDFSHVRIHRDPSARALTESAGARALTSGSHIYLGAGVQPEAPEGSRVMGHELAHVLQQTGARALGGHHSSQPDAGQPARGVHYEPAREQAADRMAEAAGRSAGPVPVEEEGGKGLAPSVRSTVLAIAGVLSGREFQEQFQERVDKEKLASGPEPPGLAQAREIWSKTKAALGTMRPANSASSFRDDAVRSAVDTYVGATHAKAVSDAIRPLAAFSQRRARGVKQPKGAPPVTELVPARFVALLRDYIFASTGVSLHIALHRGTAEFSEVGISTIHPGKIDPHAGLYDLLKTNTKAHMSKFPQPGWTPFTDSDWTAIRALIKGTWPVSGLYDRTSFRLSNAFITDYITRRTAAASLSVPDWDTYTNPDPSTPGQGLRVGTHGQLTALKIAKRESHHIPQFLLIDYFNNDSATPLFKDDSDRLPGFEPAGAAKPESYSDGTKVLDYSKLLAGARGDTMPAVLLQEETHQRGNLHLNRESSWQASDETEGTANQSNTLNRVFKEAVAERLGLPSSTPFPDVAAQANTDQKKARPQILEAMKATYKFMYEDRMKPPLREALLDLETPFYQLAAQAQAPSGGSVPPGFVPNKSGLDRVMTAVEQKNQEVMAAFRP